MLTIAQSVMGYYSLIFATIADCKTRKIPNTITFVMLIGGYLFNILFTPQNLGIILISQIVLLCLSLLPGLGMGDIKMMMGTTLFFHPTNVFLALALASVLIIGVRFVKYPILTISQLCYRQLPAPQQEKTIFNSVPLAPYFLCGVFLIEGGQILCNLI